MTLALLLHCAALQTKFYGGKKKCSRIAKARKRRGIKRESFFGGELQTIIIIYSQIIIRKFLASHHIKSQVVG